jgi:bile acid-coenzyme A ligase
MNKKDVRWSSIQSPKGPGAEDPVTPGARLAQLAMARPDEIAVICERWGGGSEALSRLQLEQWANRLANRLAEQEVGPGSFVIINLPNGLEHIVATLATYKLGGCPMPLSYRVPPVERDAMMALAAPQAVVSDAPELRGITREEMRRLEGFPPTPPPDAIPQPFKAVGSGGSTGKPKLIVSPGAFCFPAAGHPFAAVLGIVDGDRVYSPGPLYHNQAFLFSQVALFAGASIVIDERFEAASALAAVERHRPTILNVVPTMMLRMARAAAFYSRDLGSIRALWHMAAPCADWVKRAWIDRIGAASVCELWSATEVTGATTINGEEWLRRPGSVGRGYHTEIRILDAQRRPLPRGQVGEIYTRFNQAPPQYYYLGAAPLDTVEGGFASVGDLGYLDEEGFLFLADRRMDLIITGGANVFPAEVEAVLTQFEGVHDAVVIGLRDEDLGRRVHALIEPNPGLQLSQTELDAHLRKRLASYKVPRSYEMVEQLPRDEAGKIRRSQLREERGG